MYFLLYQSLFLPLECCNSLVLRRFVFRTEASAKRDRHASDWWRSAKDHGKEKIPPSLARKFSSRETLGLGTGTRQVLQHFRARSLTSINMFYGTGLYLEICDTREKFRWKKLQMSTKMMLQKKAANTMLWRPLKFRISRPICAKLWSKIIKLWLWSIFPNFCKLFPWLVYGQPSAFLITIIVFSLLAPNIYNSPVSNLSRPLNRSTEYSFIQG